MTLEASVAVTLLTVIASAGAGYGAARSRLKSAEQLIAALRIDVDGLRRDHVSLLVGDATGSPRFVTRDRCDERTARIEASVSQFGRHVTVWMNYARWAMAQGGLAAGEIDTILNGKEDRT